MCERVNRTILAVLRQLTDNHPKDWSLQLDSCTNALNSTVCTYTGVSPFKLIHGMKIRLPNQIVLPQAYMDMREYMREGTPPTVRDTSYDATVRHTSYNARGEKSARTPPSLGQVNNLWMLVFTAPLAGGISCLARRHEDTKMWTVQSSQVVLVFLEWRKAQNLPRTE